MNSKTLIAAAALAALCLMPSASAEAGPDVTVTVQPVGVGCETFVDDEAVGPVALDEDGCASSVGYDGNSAVAACTPQSFFHPAFHPRVGYEVGGDCHVHLYA